MKILLDLTLDPTVDLSNSVNDEESDYSLKGSHNVVFFKQYSSWPDQPSSGLDFVLTYENAITILCYG